MSRFYGDNSNKQSKANDPFNTNLVRLDTIDIHLSSDRFDICNLETEFSSLDEDTLNQSPGIVTNRKESSRPTISQPNRNTHTGSGTNRYVAGDQFFNYHQCGALRAGGDVSLWTKENIGLVLVVTQASVSASILKYILVPTLMSFLQVSQMEKLDSLKSLFLLPTGLSFIFGVTSDLFPIANSRRKSYMILGSVISFIVLLILVILTWTLNVEKLTPDERKSYVLYYTILFLVTSISSVMTMVAADARVVELSQQEPLKSRGHFAINYLSVRGFLLAIITILVTYMIKIENYKLVLTMHPVWFYVILSGMALVPIPFLVFFSDEYDVGEILSRTHRANVASLNGQGGEMMESTTSSERKPTTEEHNFNKPVFSVFRLCQQRAVWQYVLAVIVLVTTLHFSFPEVSAAIYYKAGFDVTLSIDATGFKVVSTLVSYVIWKYCLANVSWKKTVGAVIALALAHNIILAIIAMYFPMPKHQFVFFWFYSVEGIMESMIQIFLLIPVIEIAENGSEGAMVGLIRSYQSVVESSVIAFNLQTLSTTANVTSVTSSSEVFRWFISNYAVRALGFFVIFLIPRQKLDAQQLRVYGGYSKAASMFVIGIFLFFFFYSSGANGQALYDIITKQYIV